MLVLPFRYKEHKKELGDFHIQTAKELLDDENYRAAFTFFRSGLSRAPSNIEGRLLLAEFYYTGFRDPDLAITLLRQGLKYGYDDEKYVKTMVVLMLKQHHDLALIEDADEFLPKFEEPSNASFLLALGAASAAFHRGQYDKSEDYIKKYGLAEAPDGLILMSKIMSSRGDSEAAIALLESRSNDFQNRHHIFMELIRIYRDSGDFDKARRNAILRALSKPLSPGPRIELLHAYHYSGQEERMEEEIEKYIEQFGEEENSLALLAEFGAKTGQAELNREIYAIAVEKEYSLAIFSFLLIESEIGATNYKKALDLIYQIVNEKPDWLSDDSPIISALRSVAFYGSGQESNGAIYLKEILQNPNVRNATLIALSDTLKKIGRKHEARAILAAAYEQAPENQGALTGLMRLDIELGRIDDLNEKLINLLKMRRPPNDLLLSAYDRLGSDKFMFTPKRTEVILQLKQILLEQELISSDA